MTDLILNFCDFCKGAFTTESLAAVTAAQAAAFVRAPSDGGAVRRMSADERVIDARMDVKGLYGAVCASGRT